MATKNVYVSDSDVPLFERATELAGGMSAAVVAGLRLYVAQQEEKAREPMTMRTVEVDVQDGPLVTTKRFTGRRLLRYELRADQRVIAFRVYATERGQLAVETRNGPDWNLLSRSGDGAATGEDAGRWSGEWWRTTERSLRVFADVEAMRAELPVEVVEATARALTAPEAEDLDI